MVKTVIRLIAVFVIAPMLFAACGQAQAQTETPAKAAAPTGSKTPLFTGWQLPEKVDLCGEKVPLDNHFIREVLDQQLIIAAGNTDRALLWMRRAGRYFPTIEKKLAAAGLPGDLKYLAVTRAALDPLYSERSGAAGMWMLGEYTAKKYGLRVDKEMDERYSFDRSTDAAVKRLKDLYAAFGQWGLALAAYFCGEGCVAEAVKEQEVRDFYRLDLNGFVEDSVLRIAAVKLIMENPVEYGVHPRPGSPYPPIETDEVQVDLEKPASIAEAARKLGTDYKVLKELNPHVLGKEFPKGGYILYAPKGQAGALKSALK